MDSSDDWFDWFVWSIIIAQHSTAQHPLRLVYIYDIYMIYIISFTYLLRHGELVDDALEEKGHLIVMSCV